MQVDLRAAFRDLEREISKNIGRKRSTAKADGPIEVLAGGLEVFDVDKWRDEIAKRCTPEMTDLITEVMRQSVLDAGEKWDSLKSELDKQVQPILDESLDKIRDSVNTVQRELKEQIRGIVQANREAGAEGIATAIREGLGKHFQHIGEVRTRMIARTSATVASGAAQTAAWKPIDGIEPAWLTQRDGNVRPEHAKADGQRADADGNFTVGGEKMRSPGTGAIASNNIQCRCVLRPVFTKR